MKIAGVIGVLLTALLLQGDVFTLWPLRPGGENRSGGTLLNGVAKELLHKEKITVNGVPLEMEIFRSDESFDMLFAALKKIFQQEDLVQNGSTLRVGYRTGKGMTERWLLVRNRDGKTTIFKIAAPEKLPVPEEWPGELPPLPAGAEVVQILHFPARKSVYGSFRNGGGSPPQLLRSQSRFLESNGWIAVGAEAALQEGSGGDLFIRTCSGRELLWLSSSEDGSGSCYYKKAE